MYAEIVNECEMEGVLIQATEFQYCDVYRQHCCSSVKRVVQIDIMSLNQSSQIMSLAEASSFKLQCAIFIRTDIAMASR